jgi:hypothetical protein
MIVAYIPEPGLNGFYKPPVNEFLFKFPSIAGYFGITPFFHSVEILVIFHFFLDGYMDSLVQIG